MYKEILKKIGEYKKVVIHRHVNPDLDALGAQLGLKGIIENNFKDITVKVVGDENALNFVGHMDTVEDEFYEDALVIVVDVAVKALVSDDRYKLGKEVMVIDHHQNDSDIADYFYCDPSHIAVCQLLGDMCMQESLSIDSATATALLGGLVTDSGRFLYPATRALTFDVASYLLSHGGDLQFLYDALYTEDLNFKKLKGYFINNFRTTKQNVAYMKNAKTLKDAFNVTIFTISRGMVNQMSGIVGIPMWANFTEEDNGRILCELRSKKIPIVEVAKKYGGGGHALACGCTVHSWQETDAILKDLDALLKEGDL